MADAILKFISNHKNVKKHGYISKLVDMAINSQAYFECMNFLNKENPLRNLDFTPEPNTIVISKKRASAESDHTSNANISRREDTTIVPSSSTSMNADISPRTPP